ncbi:MAG TPA: EAL domain-containing protein [Marinagarivorans sp.]
MPRSPRNKGHVQADAIRPSSAEQAQALVAVNDEPTLSVNACLNAVLTGLLAELPVFVCALDGRGNIVYVNNRFELFEGVARDYRFRNSLASLFPAGVDEQIAQLNAEADFESAKGLDINFRHKDRSTHSYHVVKLRREVTIGAEQAIKEGADAAIPTSGAHKEIWHLFVGIDVTAHRQAEHSLRDHKSRLDYMVYHDPLTGLANRSLFYDRISKVLGRAQHTGDNFALVLIDLDRFKNVNDSLGHDAGDALLKIVAEVLSEELRETDSVARLGGDEFVVVLEGVRSISDVELVASRILHRLSVPMRLQGHEITSTASIGVSFYPRDGESIDQLLKHADIAMYRAKSAGKNRYEFFLKEMKTTLVDSLLLENELRRCIENEDMHLHYQPQIDLRTGRIVGLEALVRWQHAQRGMISPMEFIPLAEDTGLIEPLGEWVLKHACERFQSWLMSGLNFGKIAVNLSTKQFRLRRFEQTVMSILMETRLAPKYLELEITESSAMENAEEAIHMLNCLSKLGLSLAIDDFGTGYSSLAYLRRFPINKLKIDRSFVNDIDEDGNDSAIAKSIIDLAHNLKLEVLAEGVEQLSQSHWLMSKGCNQVQGFYYSKPLSEDQLLALVNSERVERDSAGVRFLL